MSDKLNIHEIFQSFQGEGPYTGRKAIFIRLGKCNLTCEFCDTDNNTYSLMSISEILKKIKEVSNTIPKINFIVITGGEPLLQPIELLCEKLLTYGYEVQIETNGTRFKNLDNKIQIICSPKNVNGKFLINKKMLERADALKFVVSKTYPNYKNIPKFVEIKNKNQIYIQPMDEGCKEKNQNNLLYAIDICKKEDYKISLQLHKLVGVR
ncbi:MAG: 7-carboxy-7-deazaguanine synthase QueE [Rickettsiales bacterium]|nr:7-carboxy-7-deazaguanine synthase QueE [Rickettsiales bacterium]